MNSEAIDSLNPSSCNSNVDLYLINFEANLLTALRSLAIFEADLNKMKVLNKYSKY